MDVPQLLLCWRGLCLQNNARWVMHRCWWRNVCILLYNTIRRMSLICIYIDIYTPTTQRLDGTTNRRGTCSSGKFQDDPGLTQNVYLFSIWHSCYDVMHVFIYTALKVLIAKDYNIIWVRRTPGRELPLPQGLFAQKIVFYQRTFIHGWIWTSSK